MSAVLKQFLPIIRSATAEALLSDPTLDGRLVMERWRQIVVSYSPFDHIERRARVVIIGITPGAQQAGNALAELHRQLAGGKNEAQALAAAKQFASFSGPMRKNLVSMLDHVGLPRWLGIDSTSSLWSDSTHLAHFTSALRYPVFVGARNYAGSPSMITTPILHRMLETYLREEARELREAVWVPLGPKVTVAVKWLVQQGLVEQGRVLEGLPHPSGANAERCNYFLGRKPRAALSSKTNPTVIDQAKERILSRVAAL